MRLVYFENDAGERINLNRIPGQTPTRGIIATNLTGMGYTPGGVFSKISAGYYRQTGEDEKMQPCGLTLNFTRNAYDTYKWLLDWMIDAGVWDYVYNTGSGEYRRRVTLEYINKPEMNKVGHLVSQMSLVTLTPWYQELQILGNNSFINVSAGGQIGTSFVIGATASSAMHNPVFTVTDADGNELQRLEFTVDIPANKRVEWSTHYYDSHITVDGADAISNVVITSNLFAHTRKAFKINFPTIMNYNGNVRRWWRTV